MRGSVRSGEASNLSPPLKQIPFYVFCMCVWGRGDCLGQLVCGWFLCRLFWEYFFVIIYRSHTDSVHLYVTASSFFYLNPLPLPSCNHSQPCFVIWMCFLVDWFVEIDLDEDRIKLCSKSPSIWFALRFCLSITLSKAQKIISYFTPQLAFNRA